MFQKGLSPVRPHVITRNNIDLLQTGPLGKTANFNLNENVT